MANHWQAEPTVRPPQDYRSPDFRGLRSFEHNWRRLEKAAARGDALELASASASAGRACLADDDPDEALWHMQRGLRFLHGCSPCGRSLLLHCELAAIGLQLADRRADDEHAARRLREDTRDAVFEVVRRAARLADDSAATAALLHGAALLAALGDDHDAETVRLQALTRGDRGTALRN